MVPREMVELLEPLLLHLQRIERKIDMSDKATAAVVAGFAALETQVSALTAAFQASVAGSGQLDAADEAALEQVASGMSSLAASISALLPTGTVAPTGPTGPAPPAS